MLRAYGFDPIWINWIMTCVTSVKFSVRFNGHLLESFHPSRGLRQGDPLSPYLFLFVAEALSLLLKDACDKGGLKDFHLNRHAPGISHLLFADDTLQFFKANADQAIYAKNVIHRYARATCQLINPQKFWVT